MTVAEALPTAGDVPASPDAGRALSRVLATASVLAVALAAVTYLVMVRTRLGQRFDDAAYAGAKAQFGAAASIDSHQLQRITADSLAAVLLVIVAIGVLRRRPLLGLGAAAAAGIAVAGTDLLKEYVLTRPDLLPSAYPVGNSFPSGHTAAAVACAMALVLVAPPRGRGIAAVVAGAYGWITAAQVETAGWHRPSDAIGAALLAFAAVTGMAAVLARGRPVRRGRGRHWLAEGVLAVVAIGVAVWAAPTMHQVLQYLQAHAAGVPVPVDLRHDAYIGGLAVTVEVVVVLLMILLALLGRWELDGQGWRRS